MLMAVPTYVHEEVYRRVDAQLAKHPHLQEKREEIASRIFGYVNEHGTIPEFSVEPVAARDAAQGNVTGTVCKND